MQVLDEHKRRILMFIEHYQNRHGRTPSYEEIRQATGMNSKDHVYRDVESLEEMNYVRRERSISRGITLLRTADGYPVSSEAYSLPVIGTIDPRMSPPHVGEILQARDWVQVTRALIPDAENVYAVKVQGNGLLDALVHDGDLVVLRKTNHAEKGQFVAVTLKADRVPTFTLKRYVQHDGEIWLQPENKAMPASRWNPEDIEIQGIVLCIIRRIPTSRMG